MGAWRTSGSLAAALVVLLAIVAGIPTAPASSQSPGSILFISRSTSPPAGDTAITSHWEGRGYDVTVADDDDLPDLAAASSFDAIWISTTVAPTKVGAVYAGLPTPIGMHEAGLYEDHGMAIEGGTQSAQKTLRLDDGVLVAVTSSKRNYSWGLVGGDVTVRATINGAEDRAAIFSFDTGATLADGSIAPGCRAGFYFGFTAATAATDTGLEELDRITDLLLTCNAGPNTEPTIDAVPDRSIVEGSPVAASLMAQDPDGDRLRFAADGLPNGLTLDADTGEISGAPAHDAAPDSPYLVTFSVSDGRGGTASTASTWAVTPGPNQHPTLHGLPNRTSTTGASPELTTTAVDLDGDPLTFSATGLPPGLDLSPAGVLSGTIPEGGEAGSPYQVIVSVQDGAGGSDQASFLWEVTSAPMIPQLLLVAGSGGPPSADVALIDHWQAAGLAVTVIDDDDLDQLGPAPPFDLVWISSSVKPSTVGDFFAGSSVPVGTHEAFIYDDLGMATASGQKANQRRLVVDGTTTTVTSSTSTFSWGTPGAAATVLATLSTNQAEPAVFLYDIGAELASGVPAPGCRAGFFAGYDTPPRLGPEGLAMLTTVTTILLDCDGGVAIQPIEDQQVAERDEVLLQFEATEAGPLTWAVDQLPDGLTLDPTSGLVNGTVADDAADRSPLATTVTVTATDDPQDTASLTFSWRVDPGPNRAPVIDPVVDRLTNEGEPVSVQLTATDPDGDPIGWTADQLPDGLVLDPATGSITGAPTTPGPAAPVTFTASDGLGGIDTATMTWTVNASPRIDPIDDQLTDEGDAASLQLTATDPDLGPLTWAADQLPAGLSLDPVTGLITGVPTIPGPAITITITATDTNNAAGTTTLDWTINTTPAIDPLPDRTDTEGESVSLQLTATDPDFGPLAWTADQLPAGLTVDAVTGLITGTVADDGADDSPYTVTVTTSDTNGATDTTTFTWIIEPGANQSPTIDPIQDQLTNQDDQVTLQLTATDPDNDPITWTADPLPTGLTLDPNTGTITGPTTAPIPATTITVSASDGLGGSDTTTFTWTVNATPIIDPPGDRTNTEGEQVTLPLTATDPDFGPLAWTASQLPDGLTLDPDTATIDGTIADDATINSPYTVTITATDTNGATDTTTFTWTIDLGPNQPPTITPIDDQLTNQDDQVTLQLTATDPDNDPITWTADPLPTGLTLDPNTGTITGAPTTPGPAVTVTITAADTNSGVDATTIDWTINTPPVIDPTPDQLTNRDQPVDLQLTATDPDFGPLTWTASQLPDGLTLDPNTGRITGAPTTPAPATTVTVTAADTNGAADTMTFDWTINTPPVIDAIADQVSSQRDQVILQLTATDPDPEQLRWAVDRLPAGLTLDQDTGRITGTVADDAVVDSPYTITVTATDTSEATDTTTFDWTINTIPQILAVADRTTTEGDDVTVQLTAVDPDFGPVSWQADGLPTGLTLDPSTGLITGAPIVGTAGDSPFDVVITATDQAGGTDATTFSWTIEPLQLADYIEVVGQTGGNARVSSFGKPCVADINGDGHLDTVWSKHRGETWSVYHGGPHGDGATEVDDAWIIHDNHGCVADDFDADGDIDLFAPQGACQGNCLKRDRLYLQKNNGQFERKDWLTGPKTNDRSRSAISLDFDNDGYRDLWVTASGSPNGAQNRLLRNLGPKPNGTWGGFEIADVGVGTARGNSTCATSADFNNDGFVELIGCQATGFLFYENNGGQQFTVYPHNIVGGDVQGVATADLDDDGWVDLILARETALEIRLNRSGSVDVVDATFPLTNGWEVVTPDIDGDGDLDLFVVQATSGQDPNSLSAHQLWINHDAATRWTRVPVPQPSIGQGNKAEVFPNFYDSGHDAVLVTNGGDWCCKGPRQWLATANLTPPTP
ncbi:MAG: putative Ig domain-containing protein [Actinomycetota bacterium]